MGKNRNPATQPSTGLVFGGKDYILLMNQYQELWWRQAKSDHEVLIIVRRNGIAQCHTLHYLQMVTEKLAKAYFWRSGAAPKRSHAGFVHLLRFLGQIRQADRERVAALFAFSRYADFQNWMRSVLPIAYELERLAPALANDGPNPEYPWPQVSPEHAPASFSFPIWSSLTSSQGRHLWRFIHIAIDRFPEFADA